jgi:hypothetical protein
MKQKLIWISLLTVLLNMHSVGHAQKSYLPSSLPLVTEVGISDITISDNINVVLMQEKPENVKVKVLDGTVSKLKISIVGGRLFLGSSKNLKEGERLVVYVWVNDLETLTLNGNAIATSKGILQNRNLHISASREAMVSLKSTGKVWIDAPENYEVAKEDGYSFIRSL